MALFATCSICGKKKPSIFIDADGICSVCKAEISKRRRKEEQQKEATEHERAQVYYDELVRLWDKAGDLYSSEGESLDEVKEKISACNDFVSLLQELPEITYFKEVFSTHCSRIDSESCHNNEFGRLNTSPADNGTICLNFEQLIDKIKARKKRLEKCLENTLKFQEIKINLPLVSIVCNKSLSEHPQESKETLSVFETKNITQRTPVKKLTTFFVVDVETTGLNPITDEIIQISAIRFSNFSPVEAFSTYIKPRQGLRVRAQAINGITEADVADAPYIEEIASCFRSFINASGITQYPPIVGHNVKFDVQFLVANNCLHYSYLRDYYDTLELSRREYKYYPVYKLDYLARECLKILRTDSHDSFSDALATGLLFKEICDLRMEAGINNIPPEIPSESASVLPLTDSLHPLYGKKIVFAGKLSVTHKEAARMATEVGAIVRNAVSGKTDYLVVGDGDTSEEDKAYDLFSEGNATLQIISEREFMNLLRGKDRFSVD